ncbi:unnamed protein product [Acanthoscelides obtectus]|uniref:DDE-1 domain-containing protein n=1 Tax=Acanthoscelides obtectus TaxID=200917 RepID=A0A9P0NUC3_ACAOB|nr:unnamed protein product [Acanthoscelides obtectus]CAK1662071.1 hypothetical protein AOBTE_LOCUS22961 [Acanthoscelides obtectus]
MGTSVTSCQAIMFQSLGPDVADVKGNQLSSALLSVPLTTMRTYKKRTERADTLKDVLERACHLIIFDTKSIDATSKQYDIPYKTLHRYVAKLKEKLERNPIGCEGDANPSGWMKEENFMKYSKHFVKHVRPTKEKPELLLLDNHDSHLKRWITSKLMGRQFYHSVHIAATSYNLLTDLCTDH